MDEAFRVMTNDHGFRVVTVDVSDSAREIQKRQKVTGTVAECLSGLVASVALLRETMAPDLRVQGLVRGAKESGMLVADSFPDGSLRALVQRPSEFVMGPGALMQMMRHLVTGGLQQGIVDVGRAGGIGEALTGYFHDSEQLVCMARVGTVFENGEIVRAGGFVVQLLPEVERSRHFVMTQRLEDLPPMKQFLEDPNFSVEVLSQELTYGMDTTELARSPLRFGCRCDETLVLSALASLGRDDLDSMISSGEGLEIDCDYCGKNFNIAPERLRALLDAS